MKTNRGFLVLLSLSVQLGAAALLGATTSGCEERTAWSAPRERPAPSPVISATTPEEPASYVVRSGDGWWSIAASHGIDMADLLTVNGATTATRLDPDQVVRIPGRGSRVTAHPAPPPPRVAPPAPRFIPYPGNGLGPTPCADGTWSHSAGRGTCSHHGGIG